MFLNEAFLMRYGRTYRYILTVLTKFSYICNRMILILVLNVLVVTHVQNNVAFDSHLMSLHRTCMFILQLTIRVSFFDEQWAENRFTYMMGFGSFPIFSQIFFVVAFH